MGNLLFFAYSSAQGKFVHVQCIKRNKGIHFLQYPPFLPPPHSIIWVTIKPVPGICKSISSSISAGISNSICFCSLAPFLPRTQSGIWVTIKPVPASSTQDTKVTHPFLFLTPSLIFMTNPLMFVTKDQSEVNPVAHHMCHQHKFIWNAKMIHLGENCTA